MADSTVNQTQPTSGQLGCVLNDIASTAKSIERFSVLLMGSDDERDTEALTYSIEIMAQRIGLLADSMAHELPGSGAIFGTTVTEWMMQPIYSSL